MKNMVWISQAVCLLGLVALSGCTSPISVSPVPTRIGTSQEQATIQALHKRLQERERTIARQKYQIAVLSGQLGALKQIDQDTRGQWRPVRHVTTGMP